MPRHTQTLFIARRHSVQPSISASNLLLTAQWLGLRKSNSYVTMPSCNGILAYINLPLERIKMSATLPWDFLFNNFFPRQTYAYEWYAPAASFESLRWRYLLWANEFIVRVSVKICFRWLNLKRVWEPIEKNAWRTIRWGRVRVTNGKVKWWVVTCYKVK